MCKLFVCPYVISLVILMSMSIIYYTFFLCDLCLYSFRLHCNTPHVLCLRVINMMY
jgi:hypothetical protein